MNTTTAIRKQMTINPKLMDLLNDQIKMEISASAAYLAMASWCDQRELLNAKSFFYKQAEEERQHAMSFFKFINDNGGGAISPTVDLVNNDFGSLREIYETSLDQEIKVTESIYKIFKTARELGDYATEVFLHFFISEQSEEEDKMRSCLDIFELMGDMPLKMIDERLPKE